MEDLPLYLKEFLYQNDYQYISIMQYNKKKGLIVLKITKNKKFFILKSVLENSEEGIKTKFKIEQEFYKKGSNCKCIPKLILETKNIFIIEFVESFSLRDLLVNKGINLTQIINLLDCIELFRKYLKQLENKQYLDNKNLYIYLSVLLNSGPFQVKNIKISKIDSFLNRIIQLEFYLYFKLKKIDFKNLTFIAHNDFHYNNILMTKNNDIKIIDYENVNNKGIFEIDTIFLLVILEVYMKNNSDEQIVIKNYLQKLFEQNKNLIYIYETFSKVILCNKKFLINSYKRPYNIFYKIMFIFKNTFWIIYNLIKEVGK